MTDTVQRASSEEDVIAAIATPPGTAGIAVLRLSGARACDIANTVFDGADLLLAESHTVHYGHILGAAGEMLDEVIVTVLREPRSYTGENTVEISCHGGSVVSRLVLETLLKAGARHAEPGEFTRRAFLNGKLDLVQAEAVADLIHARSEEAHHASLQQLEGRLSGYVDGIREGLMHATGMLELSLDFVEEDVAFLDPEEVTALLDDSVSRLRAALESYSGGRVLRDGARVALLGAPNVGKSSLLNALLGIRRAIVTETPGTTRDYIEEQILLHGEFIRLIDTAGLRETDDAIELEGIAISREALQQADIVCLVADARDGIENTVKMREQAALDENDARVLLLFNKADLVDDAAAADLRAYGSVCSALRGTGLDELTQRLAEMARELRGSSEQGSVLVTNARHADCLRRGIDALVDAQKAQEAGMTEEVLAGDLRRAIDALGEIIGAVTTDDILNGIFSRFCIGK